MSEESAADWASAEFGHAVLGDPRRTRRLVKMGAALMTQPAGRITQVFDASAQREAAYRLVGTDKFSWREVADAMHVAAARRAAAFEHVIVPIDGVAFTMTTRSNEFGPICRKVHNPGAHAMTALALTPNGVTLGLLAHEWWTRSSKAAPAYKTDKRPVTQRETGHWLRALDQATAALAREAPSTRPWFQLDRGGDCADVLRHAIDLGVDVTVRACYDRCVTGGKLWAKAAAGRFVGTYPLTLRRPGQPLRTVVIAVRIRRVELQLRLGPNGKGPLVPTTVQVVEARERRAEKGVLWRLITTVPVANLDDAMAVITGYTRRWRIEEFHLAWKSGACGIEHSWMRRREHFFKWATLASAVAARLERIKLLSREAPTRPALDEFTRDEIDATIALRKPKGIAFGAEPTLGDVTRWIADLGGYTGKSSGGPPGIRVLTRGFDRVLAAAIAVATIRKDPGWRG